MRKKMPRKKLNKTKLNKLISEIKDTLSSDIMMILQEDCSTDYLRLRLIEEANHLKLDSAKSFKLIAVLALIGLMRETV